MEKRGECGHRRTGSSECTDSIIAQPCRSTFAGVKCFLYQSQVPSTVDLCRLFFAPNRPHVAWPWQVVWFGRSVCCPCGLAMRIGVLRFGSKREVPWESRDEELRWWDSTDTAIVMIWALWPPSRTTPRTVCILWWTSSFSQNVKGNPLEALSERPISCAMRNDDCRGLREGQQSIGRWKLIRFSVIPSRSNIAMKKTSHLCHSVPWAKSKNEGFTPKKGVVSNFQRLALQAVAAAKVHRVFDFCWQAMINILEPAARDGTIQTSSTCLPHHHKQLVG